jgi:hypothetical protein
VTESAGKAVADTIKVPMDKSCAVEGTLEKAASKTADTIKAPRHRQGVNLSDLA